MDDILESLDTSVGTANLAGVVMSVVTYGVHITLFAELNCLFFSWSGVNGLAGKRGNRRDWRLLIYVYVLFLLATTGLCLQTWVNHDAFVIHGAFPGGPLVYLAQQTYHPAHLVTVTIYVVLNWSADGMLLYRAYVLSKFSKYVSATCTLAAVAVIGLGGYFIHAVGSASIRLWTDEESERSLVGYLSLMFSINIVFTVGTVGRLLYIRQELGILLEPEAARVYTSIAAMLVESASLYTVATLCSIVACAMRLQIQDALLPMLGQLQAIPPLMIIVRVMEGRAVTEKTWSTTTLLPTLRVHLTPLRRNPALTPHSMRASFDSDSSSLPPDFPDTALMSRTVRVSSEGHKASLIALEA